MISDEEKNTVIFGMDTYGGGFVQGLAQALKSADKFNTQKIKDNWKALWQQSMMQGQRLHKKNKEE